MKKLLGRISTLIAAFSICMLVMVPAVVSAQNPSVTDVCEGVKLTGATSCGPGDTAGTTGIANIIETVINLLSLLVGVVAVIMIIVGGLKYIMSSGDASNTASAKNTILFAIVGLVVVALAQIIVRFVLNKVG